MLPNPNPTSLTLYSDWLLEMPILPLHSNAPSSSLSSCPFLLFSSCFWRLLVPSAPGIVLSFFFFLLTLHSPQSFPGDWFLLQPPLTWSLNLDPPFSYREPQCTDFFPHSHGCKHTELVTHRFTAHVLPLAQGLFPCLWLTTGHFHLKLFPVSQIQHSLAELALSPTKASSLSQFLLSALQSLSRSHSRFKRCNHLPSVSQAYLCSPGAFPRRVGHATSANFFLQSFSYLLEFLFPSLCLHHRGVWSFIVPSSPLLWLPLPICQPNHIPKWCFPTISLHPAFDPSVLFIAYSWLQILNQIVLCVSVGARYHAKFCLIYRYNCSRNQRRKTPAPPRHIENLDQGPNNRINGD